MWATKTKLILLASILVLAGAYCSSVRVTLFSSANAATNAIPASAARDASQLQQMTEAKRRSTSSLELTEADEKLLKSLNLRQKIGQMFMIGFMGTTIDGSLSKMIQTVKPGAIVVFGRNIKSARQIATLNLEAQKASLRASKLPLLIAVDQEGGNVIRIKTAMPLPSALALGETDDLELVETAGHETGILLRTLGFNMNLAPVLDVSDPAERSFIGTRTFGSEPATVLRMGSTFAKGLLRSGVLATAKHFPGHGGIKEDSHNQTPRKEGSLSELLKADLMPFAGMKSTLGAPWALMLAHISYPGLDPSGMPATFSKPIVDAVLRKHIGFDGLVLTDDIEMAGAFMIKDVNERAVRAIEAGVDMVMVAWNRRIQAQVTEAVYHAVKSGRLSEERIDTSVRRILAYKRLYVPTRLVSPTPKQLVMAVRNPAFQMIAEKTVAATLKRSSSRINRDAAESDPTKPVFIFTANGRFYSTFKNAVGRRRTRLFRLGNDLNFDIDRVMRSNPEAVGVFYLSGRGTARIANKISEDVAKRIVVVNVETEGMLKNPHSFRQIADVYYRHPNLGRLTAEHFFAEADTRGPADVVGAREPINASRIEQAPGGNSR